MNSSNLSLARSILLTPFGLDDIALTNTLASMFTHKVDYADLYFQFTKSEGWSLEEGIVKTGSFNIDQGVGIRAVAGDKTAFAYSDDISLSALQEAVAATRTIAKYGQGKIKVGSGMHPHMGTALYLPHDPLESLDSSAKVQLLEKVEKLARAKDPRVKQVMAGLAAEYDVVLVARSDGVIAGDVRPLVRLSVTVIAEQNGRREMGSSGGGGRHSYAYFTDELIEQYVDEAVSGALVNLDARSAPAGPMTVVLGPGWPGVLLHEAIGHGLEGDFNRKGSSAFSGRLGQKVAASGVTVVDDGTLLNRRGSLSMDDEGNPTQCRTEKGAITVRVEVSQCSHLPGSFRECLFVHYCGRLPCLRASCPWQPGEHWPGATRAFIPLSRGLGQSEQTTLELAVGVNSLPQV